MSVIDTNTKLIPTAEARAAIAQGRVPIPKPPRKPYVGRHFHIEDQETTVISPETVAAVRTPVPASDPPVDKDMRKLARLLGNLRKPRWLP